VTYGTVFYKIIKGELPKMLALPLVLNLVFNLIYSPIQFGLKNNYLAAVDILLVLGTLVWGIVVLYPEIKWAAVANVPYLLWVSFATVLQLTITWLNRG
jgi:tryptophan-rich sensory protein